MLGHVLLVCLIPSPAAAQEHSTPARAVVVVVRAPDGEASTLRERLAQRWARRGVESVPIPPAPELGRPDMAALAAARRSFAELRPREAIASLDEFIAETSALGGGVSREAWISALLLLARSWLAVGDATRAAEALDRVLGAAPELELDQARYPPPLREALESRRAALAADDRLSMRLEHAPPGLMVALDCAPPVAPDRLPTLAPGVHLMRLEAPGRRPRALRVELDARHRDIDATLAPDAFAPLRPRPGYRPSTRELRLAASRLGASPLLLEVRRRGTGSRRIRIWDAGRDLRAAITLRGSHSPRQIAAAAVAALARVESQPLRRRRRRVIWAVGAGAVVLTAAAAVALVLTRPSESGFRLQLDDGSGTP